LSPVAVFDTNILISALLWQRGLPFECLLLARERRAGSITCEEILLEFGEKLQSKFRYSAEDAQRAADEVRRLSTVVPIAGSLRIVAADPGDDKVLECAAAGGATHVVTGDRKHLLPMRTFGSVTIVSAAEFVTLVASAPRQ
jgi:putative PIN family toxin of toxin-antitoxin system